MPFSTRMNVFRNHPLPSPREQDRPGMSPWAFRDFFPGLGGFRWLLHQKAWREPLSFAVGENLTSPVCHPGAGRG